MIRPVVGLALASLLLTSCMSFSDRSFRPVTHALQRQLPGLELEKEFSIAVGGTWFNLLDVVAVGVDFDFSKVKRFQLAVYNVATPLDARTLEVERSLMARDPRLSWETVVRVRKEQQQTWIMVGLNEARQRIDAVSVLVLDNEELVLINASGDFQQMLAFAFNPIKDQPGSVNL